MKPAAYLLPVGCGRHEHQRNRRVRRLRFDDRNQPLCKPDSQPRPTRQRHRRQGPYPLALAADANPAAGQDHTARLNPRRRRRAPRLDTLHKRVV